MYTIFNNIVYIIYNMANLQFHTILVYQWIFVPRNLSVFMIYTPDQKF